MRIAHVCLRYPPATGGVETYVQNLVERTRDIDTGRDVRVLTSRLKTHWPPEELSGKALLDDPPYVQRLPYKNTPGLAYPRLQALAYYLHHHRPSIIHGYSFWYQPADTVARYARQHRIPFIFHPMYYDNHVRRKLPWRIYKNTIGRSTFAAASVVVVISPFEQSAITAAELPVRRFALIPPGIDANEISKPQLDPFQKRGITGNIILLVSRLAPGKGVEEAISSMPELLRSNPHTSLAIVGEDFGLQASLQKQARRLGVAKSVHFLGHLSRVELIATYQHATLLLHPSHYEAFGIVVAEASAAGLPIVARNVAAIPYVALPNKTSLLFNTPSELKSHVITLLSQAQLRTKLGSAGKLHIHNNFSWDTSIKKIAELYREFGVVS